MGLIERFFGKRGSEAADERKPIANPALENPLCLQVLFGAPLKIDSDGLARSLRAYHPELARATCDVQAAGEGGHGLIGVAGWEKHVVNLVGIGAPMPSDVVEFCVRASHYKQELKQEALRHQAHVLLYYAGYEESPYEQYVALAAVAGALAEQGALTVLNESARASFPAVGLARSGADDTMALLHGMLLLLYCGFVKYEVQDVAGVWMRTHGGPLLGLPDLAFHAEGHHQGQDTFNIFQGVLGHVLNSGTELGAGHTMQVGEDTFLRLRSPTEEESFLEGDGALFVAELIRADQVNRPR